MARLSQSEARALTRSRLIEAAERIFAEKGFAAASLQEISDAAGYTRGAVYYNFSDKEELFLAVLRKRSDSENASIGRMIRATDDPGQLMSALKDRAQVRRSDKSTLRWAQLSDEFWLYALRNPKARRLLAEHQRRLRAAYAEGINTVFSHLGIASPVPLEHLGALLLALDHSLPRQRWLDPHALPEDIFFDLVDLLTRAAQALDQQTTFKEQAAIRPG